MDGGKGQVSERMAPRRPKKTKNNSGTLRWTDRRSCNSTVLVHRSGTYTTGSLDVQGCADVPIL